MLYCTNCGKPLNENEKFCINCGTQVKQENLTSKNPKGAVSKTPVPPAKKQEGKYTKEGRKIIGAGPKPNQKYKAPSQTPKPKKNSFLGYLGKIALSIFAILIVGIIIIWNLPEGSTEESIVGKDNSNEIENNEKINSKETFTSPKATESKEILLDDNDVNSADKYRNGVGVEPNQYKAFELYEKFAEKGDLNAMVELSDYYEQGIWVEKDSEKAKQLLKQAADAGSIAAKWQLEFLESEK